jgi:CHAT domain-containing protein
MDKRIERNVGLAEAFLRGGVANYIGTYWPVGDASASQFAQTFYRCLLEGQSLGTAVTRSRAALLDLASVDWADYIHYGSQDFVLREL